MESLTGPTSSVATDDNRGGVKEAMKNFWLDHSESVETHMTKMILDSNAIEICKEELPEVLSLLPNIRGKKVLELASGVGRFTGILAEQASHVTTVDFMEPFIEESKRNNKNHTNIDYVIDDVMNLEFEKDSFDLIFSNWLLIYFSEDDIHKLARRLLIWLKNGGFFFFRESCNKPSGNMGGNWNPSLYRYQESYNNYFQNASVRSDDQNLWGFHLRFTRNLQSYIKLKGNRDSICWLMEKKLLIDDNHDCDYKQFLRNKENSKRKILRYEKIFGEGFVNIGGLQIVQEFTNTLHHLPRQKVLDVGCGIGGADFYIAKEYGAEVLGVDVSSILIEIAWEKKYKNDEDAHVCFEIGDVTDREYPSDFFDVIISRDALSHVRNKKAQMMRFFDWMKAGGRILISDFCQGERPEKEHSAGSPKRDGCELYTLKAYWEMIEAAGFEEVKQDDRSKEMVAFINSARIKITENMEEYLVDFTNDDLTRLVTGWDNDVKKYEARSQMWCLFSAQKPRSDNF